MRKLLALIAVMAILSMLLPANAFAGRRWEAASPVGSDTIRPCDIYTFMNKATGHSSSSPNYDRWGVQAIINPGDTGFGPCGTGNSDHASLWIGITQREGDNGARILQLGVMECDWSGQSVCSGSTPHFFYAAGGCGTHLPTAIDLGVAGYASHIFKIGHSSKNNHWYLWIDKNRDGDTADAGEQVYTLTYDDPRTECWINDATPFRAIKYIGEQGDSGDGLGNYPNDASWFLDTQYQRAIGGTFITDYWNTQTPFQNCYYRDVSCDLGGQIYGGPGPYAPTDVDLIRIGN